MEHFPQEILGRNAVLAGTHGKWDETRNSQIVNWDWSNILEQREVIQLHILLCLFQEHLGASLNLGSMKSCIVLRIRTYRSK